MVLLEFLLPLKFFLPKGLSCVRFRQLKLGCEAVALAGLRSLVANFGSDSSVNCLIRFQFCSLVELELVNHPSSYLRSWVVSGTLCSFMFIHVSPQP